MSTSAAKKNSWMFKGNSLLEPEDGMTDKWPHHSKMDGTAKRCHGRVDADALSNALYFLAANKQLW